MGAGPHPGRRPRAARQPRVADRRRRAGPVGARSSSTAPPATAPSSPRRRSRSSATRSSTRSSAASPTGSETAARSTTPRTLSPEKRTRYSRHLLIPEIGEEGQFKLLDSRILLIGAGGLGSPAVALPRGRGRRHDRDRRRRHRRRDEPAAADRALARDARHAEGRLGQALDRGAQPGRRRAHLPRAPHLREHRPDPRRRLGPDRRRRRQLPDPLPRQRRVGLARTSRSCTARSTASRAR